MRPCGVLPRACVLADAVLGIFFFNMYDDDCKGRASFGSGCIHFFFLHADCAPAPMPGGRRMWWSEDVDLH